MRFDIKTYYPSINHSVLISSLAEIYRETGKKPISRNLRKCLLKELPLFLSKTPYNQGLPIGSSLSYVLSGIFLLSLDLRIKNPFLRFNDDYLIFCKNAKEPELILKNTIIPILKELDLELNCKKLSSGRFHRDRVNFIGFEFFSGHFLVQKEKLGEFKRKIAEITRLNRKKSKEAIIKSLNNKILGFGYYYKFASCNTDFKDLDSFIRMRLRRYLLKQKELIPGQGSLILTNEILKNLGLKSLKSIKEEFDRKTRKKRKTVKNDIKTGKRYKTLNLSDLSILEEKYKIDYLINQLKQLTSLVKSIDRKIRKIEKKVE